MKSLYTGAYGSAHCSLMKKCYRKKKLKNMRVGMKGIDIMKEENRLLEGNMLVMCRKLSEDGGLLQTTDAVFTAGK